jgi:hypothetical protein
MDANPTDTVTKDHAAEKRKVLGKTDPAEAAKRRLQIHVVMIFMSGMVCFTLITLGVASPALVAWGPFTPSFLQEVLDFIKGLS